jgi:long-chain acyl-CoA synthetase
MTNFYKRLEQETKQNREKLYNVELIQKALNGTIDKELYVKYLTQAFHHVSHTVPFLMTMGSLLPANKRWMQKTIVEYLEEEVGHEEWILNDIAVCGVDKEAARASTPNLETQTMIAYNYDYMKRKNPVGFFGMVYMLESTSTQIATQSGKGIQETLGLPNTAFSYLYSHGTLDIKHMKFFEEQMLKITDKDDQDAIIEVANNTFVLFANLLSSVK